MRACASLMVLMMAAAGCAGTTDGAGDAVGDQPDPQIWDRTFVSVTASVGGQSKQLVDGTRIKLTFSNGNVQGHAGCNQMVGPATVENGRLIVPELASTLMACEDGLNEQDAWLTQLLEGRPTVRFDGDTLVLASDSAELRLADDRSGEPAPTLTGTRWLVESLVEGESAVSVPVGAGAYLIFDGDRVEGFTSCRELTAKVAVNEERITFSQVKRSKAQCPDGTEKLDPAMSLLLDEEVTYRIEGDLLILTGPAGPALHLRAQP